MRKTLALLCVLSVLAVGGVALADDPDGDIQGARDLLAQADALLAAEQAKPPVVITVTETVVTTTTTTVTETAPPPTTPPPTTTTTPPQTCVGTSVTPGSGLKAAVDAAPAGTTFCLEAGDYTISATTTLQDGDKLIGVGSETHIVGNGTVQNMFTGASGGTFEVRDLEVSGAVGDANATCSPDCGRAFMGNGEKWTFDGIRCHDNENQCIGTGSADIHFLNSECDHNGNPAFAAATNRSTSCIKRVRGATTNIHTVIRGSNFHDNQWSAVWFDFYEGDAIIEDNVFTDNGKTGIQVEVTGGFNAADNILIQNNVFHGQGWYTSTVEGGVICANCADTLIQTNTFGSNAGGAVRFVKSARGWGGYINVRVLNNALNGDTLDCPSPGVTCSGNA